MSVFALLDTITAKGWATWWGPYTREADIDGGVNYALRLLVVNTGQPHLSHDRLLLLLCHELGHILAQQRGFARAEGHGGRDEAAAEARAYLYGWAVLRRLQLDLSKVQWRRYHV